MSQYLDIGGWHDKVGHTIAEYGLYQGRKIVRLCNPLDETHSLASKADMPGLQGSEDGQKWPILKGSDIESLGYKLMRWPMMPDVIVDVRPSRSTPPPQK